MSENKKPNLNKDRALPTYVESEVKPSTEVESSVPTEDALVEVGAVPEPAFSIKIEYVGGQGIELAYPLSNGLRSFQAGKVYELKNYGDFCRLTEASQHFVEVKDEPAR